MREALDNYADLLEAGSRLSIHPDSVRRLIRQGKIPAFKFANKWLIRKDELEQFALTYDSRPGRKATLF
jgi:excisionase family DNA binding protein